MLSADDNQILTRVGPGTLMGNLIRCYWIPAFLSEEVSEPDGTPLRVRLLGEDLVAFRNTEGKVGLLEEACPHRGASLALGVNAESGIRCLYHGWKYGVDGACLETPTEPENSTLCERIRAKSYPTLEVGGMIWTYMGDPETMPAFPEFEWLNMPEAQSIPYKVLEDCNYAQGMEGTIDSAHAGVLHRESPWGMPAKLPHERDLRPKLEFQSTQYGLRYGAIRKLSAEQSFVRVTEVVLPFMTLIPPDGEGPRKDRRVVHIFVPRDDYSTWHMNWLFDHSKPIDKAFRVEEAGYWLDDDYRKLANIDNWYLQDRAKMKAENMSGIRGIMTQDHAVCETMGVIYDRTKEHLGAADLAVVAWRRMMIKAARNLAEKGEIPAALTTSLSWSGLQSSAVGISGDQSWKDIVPVIGETEAAIDA